MDRDLLDRWMHEDRGLHLETGNVLAASAQIILLAIDEVEEPVLVESADVTGMKPQIVPDLQCIVGTSPVPLKDDIRQQGATDDLACFADRDLIVVRVEDADIEFRRGLSR